MTGGPYLAPRWTPEFCRPICPKKKVYSCSVSGFACPVMTCTSGMLLTAGCRLTKSMSHLVLIVISLPIPFESYLWTLAFLTLICFLDPRRLTEATLAIRSSMRSHRLRMRFRHRPKYFPHLNSFCCGPSGWTIGLWPEPPTDGPHERKYRGPCSCRLNGILLPFLHWDKVSLLGCLGTKGPHLGPPLGLRSCSSRSFFPMICHWMIGMQGSSPCQLCGLTCLCWVLTICAR